MPLDTMRPEPSRNAEAHTDAIETLRAFAGEITVRVWGGDWCKDCRALLPGFATALSAAGIRSEDVVQYAVEKETDGSKTGPGVADYDIEYIPTIVVERNGEEVARFVESDALPPAEFLAARLAELEPAR